MKILEQNDYRLRLRERPFPRRLLIGLLFFVVPSSFILVFFPTVEVHCQRHTLPYECIATVSSFGTLNRLKIPLARLRQAKFEEYLDSGGNRTYTVVLEEEGHSTKLGFSSSNASDRAAMVQQINQFLANPNQKELLVRVDDDLWVMGIVAVVFVVLVMTLIAFTPVITLDLDRNRGTFTIHRVDFFRKSQRELPLGEISDITIEGPISSDGDRLYRVVVHLTSGDTVPLQRYHSSGYESKKELANRLRQFLYLPPL